LARSTPSSHGDRLVRGPRQRDVTPILRRWPRTPHPRWSRRHSFEAAQKLRERVAAEIKTTFASHYTKEVSLAGTLDLKEIAIYSQMGTGAKYLINPNKGF
jgi:hypothetical protein